MTAAHCDCAGSPAWSAMLRLHSEEPNRYHLCSECGAIREGMHRGVAILRHQ
jgi:hypothetical protein